MRRRDFLKVMAGSSLLFITRKAFPLTATAPPVVGVVRGADVERAVIKAVELVGGIGRFVKPGAIVVVKPNIAWNVPPQLKATTDPLVVRMVVHLCFQARAAKVYVFDRTCSNPRLTYVTSGIARAAREAGATVLEVDEVSARLYQPIAIPGGVYLKESLINKRVLEADALINVPVAKHHSSSLLTLGMKNMMGITGDNRQKWHWQLHEAISDINLAVRSHLTVIDATFIMLRSGPTGGSKDYLKKTDTIIAASNVASADAEAARLFGKAPESIGYLALAGQKGIGALSGYSREEAAL